MQSVAGADHCAATQAAIESGSRRQQGAVRFAKSGIAETAKINTCRNLFTNTGKEVKRYGNAGNAKAKVDVFTSLDLPADTLS